MLIREYEAFVGKTTLAAGKPEAFDIALYGLAGEIGSLVAALKKRLLAAARQNWDAPNEEIIEELGDSLWYLFALGGAAGVPSEFLPFDIRTLQVEVSGDNERGRTIRDRLGKDADRFLTLAPEFLAAYGDGSATLDDYRRLAFLTSRTKNDQLVEVCVAVLLQLTAELFRTKLPPIEHQLNKRLEDRGLETVLSEIAWHLSALASLYKLELKFVARRNIVKLERRFGRGEPTSLPDEKERPEQQFPRNFSVTFVSVGPGRSRMYLDGRRLGDDLTDNAYAEDGYRFHDIMHLALVAKLGWSPVLRKLLNRKRKSDPRVDEIEDGARAAIVEEAVIKAIHSEGVRVAALASGSGSVTLFANGADISFTFLKRLDGLVSGLEVEKSKYWEWEDAIVEGFAIFQQLRSCRQGTVYVDLKARSISFSPEAFVDVHGAVAGIGSATADTKEVDVEFHKEEQMLVTEHGPAAVLCRRRAILRALGLDEGSGEEVRIVGWRDDLVDVRVSGVAEQEVWRRAIVAFRVSTINDGGRFIATAIAVSNP